MSFTSATEGREPSASAAAPRARLTHEEAVARARALAPALKERAAEAEALRRLPDASCDDFRASGLFGILQPARWGGSELDLRTFLAVGTELARGCSSSAWVYTVTESHFWILSLFPEQAQQDVWAARPDTLIATSVAPGGQVERAPDGYRLRGRWGFSSGCDLAEWAIVGGLVPPETPGPPAFKFFLLPQADYAIDDDWFTAGMRGTGSKSLVVADAFIPEHRTVDVHALFEGHSPGRAVNAAPLYRLPLLAGWPTTFMGPALGTALAAYEAWRERARTRPKGPPGATQAEHVPSQLRLAESHAQIDCAQLLIQRDLNEVMETVAAGQELTLEQRARVGMDFCYVLKLCMAAIDRLYEASGGTSIYDASPMQRYWRDVHTIAAHHALDWDTTAEQFGRIALGLPPKPVF
jgi:3-hydroxy-9,10-secoandrosta-1,3,5(10)-triene-9,17-dione monooxygenase